MRDVQRTFVIEAIMVAIYGELLIPSEPVEFFIPYTTIEELYEIRDSREIIMPEAEDEAHVRLIIAELIAFFEEPFNKKKIERSLAIPWAKSPPLPINEKVTFTVVNALEDEEYGDAFDPIETELILTAQLVQAPILSDDLDFVETLVQAEIPVQIYDMDDFEFAVEDGIPSADW